VINALNAPSVDASAFPNIEPYLDIAETAGEIAVQLFSGRPDAVEVTYAGAIAEEDVDLVTASALKGVFSPLRTQVNAVNAPQVAENRGIDVTESKTRQSEDFQSLVTVTVSDDEDELSISGTLFAGDDPRIVRVDGYRVDAVPHGRILIARNRDEPGVIGFIGTVLGENDVNIAGMYNGRETIGGEALTVYSLDDSISEAVREQILADDRVTDVTYVELNGAE
jgi:D-3-phosphoglycerate dehydrogenase